MLDDGGIVLHSWGDGRHRLHGFDRNGAQRWSREYEANRHAPSLRDAPPFTFTASNGVVLVAINRVAGDRVASTVELLDATNGASRWRIARTLLDERRVRSLTIDPVRRLALVTRDGPSRPILTGYSFDDGRELGARSLACAGGATCSAQQLVSTRDGSLRRFGSAVEVQRIELDAMLEPAAPAQLGVLGTWYSPGTGGQGLVFDTAPASGTLFAGWFTFDRVGTHDASGQRWYTLGGTVPTGARVAMLDLYTNTGGRFATPPITTAARVGSARLRLVDCGEMVLSYRFESGELAGLEGDVDLTRLTPAVHPCVDAVGTTVPPAGASRNDAAGLSTSQSGAWFSPDSGGQGLLFDLRPPSPGDDGHLFAGWFTYDAATPQDDPTAQHWFVLDGSLAQARGGVATVPIQRAIGGRFDRRATRNVNRVGEATLRFSGCDRATLAYRFDDSDLAAEFAGRRGEVALVRLLPCQAP